MGTAVRRRSRRGAALVALVGVTALGACGGGSKSSATPSTGAQRSAATSQAIAAYRQCLSDHGVASGRRTGGTGGSQVPDSGGPPSSRAPLTPDQQAKRQAAQQACQSKLPPGYAQQRQQDLAAYRSCLADHGVNLPATPSGSGTGLQGINRNDPTFQAAQKVCAPLMPNSGRLAPGSKPTSTSTTAAR
jgi:hypothetical protein